MYGYEELEFSMSAKIPDEARDLLDRPIVVTLVTLMEDNQPQATPMVKPEHVVYN